MLLSAVVQMYLSHIIYHLRNRKHFSCFYRLMETGVKVLENEKCIGNTCHRRVFPQYFRVLPNLHEGFYNSIETQRKCFLLLLENSSKKITENEENLIVLIIIKTQILYSMQFTLHNLINQLRNRNIFCVFIELQKHEY